jgi:xanthine dehydrogenase accessory factor
MSGSWIDVVARAAVLTPIVRAVVIDAKGSTPREAGAWMMIGRDHIEGTIGGGALEHACIARARDMLGDERTLLWRRATENFHLGPELNQCCGGAVTILLERFGSVEAAILKAGATIGDGLFAVHPLVSGQPIAFELIADAIAFPSERGRNFVEVVQAARTPLMLYGAGHVGRAVVLALGGLPFTVKWFDARRDGEPNKDAGFVTGDLPAFARAAPHSAFHVVMTHSHALDEEIVAAILETGNFGYLGLIGSATKGARFKQRLLKAGQDPAPVSRIHCPIGLPGLYGKTPPVIAASVAADLLLRRQKQIDPGTAVQ